MKATLTLLTSIVLLVLSGVMVTLGHQVWAVVFILLAILYPAYIGL